MKKFDTGWLKGDDNYIKLKLNFENIITDKDGKMFIKIEDMETVKKFDKGGSDEL